MDLARPKTRALLLTIVLGVALAVRLAHFFAVHHLPFFAQLVMDSRSYDTWAQKIAGGDWVGTTAFFQAPLYPYLLAIVYRAIGHSLDAVYLLQILAAVAGIAALYRAVLVMGGARLALVAAALAALYGPFLFYDVQIEKESLAVTATCFLLWALVAARGPGGFLGCGAVLGALALLRENALLLVPFLLPLAWRGGGGRAAIAKRAAAFVGGLVLVLTPVAIRNAAVGGGFLPTTSQGGVNFYIGNHPGAPGTYVPIVPGKQVPELERAEPTRIARQETGRALTPAEVSSFWLAKSLRWAAAHPFAFLALQVKKIGLFWSGYEFPDAVDYYWTRDRSPVYRIPLLEFESVALLAVAGLWLVRKRPGPFAAPILFALGWTVSTVAFFVFSRYRLPIVPALLPLAAVPLLRVADDLKARKREGTIGLLAVIAVLALPHVAFYRPRMDLVEYNLARLAQERGATDEAEAHYRAAYAANPKDFLVCMNLGSIAARRSDFGEALRWYDRAEALQPASDDVEANLGGVLLALGRWDDAQAHLDRALALNPDNAAAKHNREILERRRASP